MNLSALTPRCRIIYIKDLRHVLQFLSVFVVPSSAGSSTSLYSNSVMSISSVSFSKIQDLSEGRTWSWIGVFIWMLKLSYLSSSLYHCTDFVYDWHWKVMGDWWVSQNANQALKGWFPWKKKYVKQKTWKTWHLAAFPWSWKRSGSDLRLSFHHVVFTTHAPALSLCLSPLQAGKINLLAAQRREQHILLMVLSMVSCYLLCWMPYGVTALMATFGTSGMVTPMASVVPSVLAKFSTVVNPVIYIFLNNQVRAGWGAEGVGGWGFGREVGWVGGRSPRMWGFNWGVFVVVSK